MRLAVRVAVYLIVVSFGLILPFQIAFAQADAPASSLADDLKTRFRLAKVGADSAGYAITEPGTVLVVQKGGILGVPPGNAVTPPSTYKDGDLHPPSAGVKMFIGNDTKLFDVGEKIYVIKLDVNVKAEKVQLIIIECDACNRVRRPSMYKSEVVFLYPKGYLEGADAGQVADVIGQVLAPEAAGGDQQQAADPGPPLAPQQAQPPPPAPAPAPAPAQAPATVQIGMTPQQVEAIFGQPERKFNGGAKQIYFYKDLKVTFINGKVTDVE